MQSFASLSRRELASIDQRNMLEGELAFFSHNSFEEDKNSANAKGDSSGRWSGQNRLSVKQIRDINKDGSLSYARRDSANLQKTQEKPSRNT